VGGEGDGEVVFIFASFLFIVGINRHATKLLTS
jgi:hypothetical protein